MNEFLQEAISDGMANVLWGIVVILLFLVCLASLFAAGYGLFRLYSAARNALRRFTWNRVVSRTERKAFR